MALSSPRDANRQPAIGGASTLDGSFVTPYVDPVTKRLYVNADSFSPSLYKIQHYADSTYDYFCFALPGTLLSTTSWLIKRITSDGSLDYPNGSASFNQAATNLATVQGYTYS